MVPHGRIEEAAAATPGITRAVVVAVADAARGEKLVLLYMGEDGVSPENLWNGLSQSELPNLWIPKRQQIHRVPELPVLATGKIDLQATRRWRWSCRRRSRPDRAMSPGEFRNFEEFWPHYVREHRRPGRGNYISWERRCLRSRDWRSAMLKLRFLPVAPIVAYGLAWIAHIFIERNKPATFRHPLWSVRGDLRMYGLMWRGRMADEVRRLAQD